MKAWMKTWAALCVAFLTGWPLAVPAQNTHTLPAGASGGLRRAGKPCAHRQPFGRVRDGADYRLRRYRAAVRAGDPYARRLVAMRAAVVIVLYFYFGIMRKRP